MPFLKPKNPDAKYWCADCGETMRFNVPRLGPDGGYVHDKTHSLTCGPYVPPVLSGWSPPPPKPEEPVSDLCPRCEGSGHAQTAKSEFDTCPCCAGKGRLKFLC